MSTTNIGGVDFLLDGAGYLTRCFVVVDGSGEVVGDLEVSRESWVGKSVDSAWTDVTTHPQWKGVGSLMHWCRQADGSFTEPKPAPAPRIISRGDFIARVTFAEHMAFKTLANQNITASVWWDRLMAREQIHLDSDEMTSGLAYIKSIGIPSVWPDEKTADDRIATIRA